MFIYKKMIKSLLYPLYPITIQTNLNMDLVIVTNEGNNVTFPASAWEKSEYLKMLSRTGTKKTDMCATDAKLLATILSTSCLPSGGDRDIMPRKFTNFSDLLDFAGVDIDLEYGNDDTFRSTLGLTAPSEHWEDEYFDDWDSDTEEYSDDFGVAGDDYILDDDDDSDDIYGFDDADGCDWH
jgi:hypothetical protein